MAIRSKHWTRAEYERVVGLGAFRPGERIELIGGALAVREPQGGPHATAVGLAQDALHEVFGDIAVVAGRRRDHRHAHPSHPVLIIEVADSSLELVRGEKAAALGRLRHAARRAGGADRGRRPAALAPSPCPLPRGRG
ncbi:MAG TPA: hypothetical protein VJX92_00875 [Methylomirabilota bacterium]|nr:hypothetical protein [Methylomirabilota bacterium]